MKKYRIFYRFCSCTTEWIIRAENEDEAKRLFAERKGDIDRIITIEEMELTPFERAM